MYKRAGHIAGGPRGAPRGPAEPVAPAEPRLPVLLIVHQQQSSPGNVGNWFAANGFPLDIRRPRFGDPLPDTLEGHTGAVIFGGPQSANDTEDFIRREIDWISVALREEKPFLGICLGAQMLALHLGGEVGAHPQGCVEMGYYPIEPTAEGARQMDWPDQVYQWHREGFRVPQSAQLLARGKNFQQQAFSSGSAFGLQFHPEITDLVMNRWVTRSGYRLVMPGARPGRDHRRDHLVFGPRQRNWLDQFLRKWTGVRAH